MKMNARGRQRGMALIIVLVLTTVLLASAMTLMRSGREYRSQVTKSIRELQAQYMAAGAIQHAELKIRLFPTELYDASMYSLGKNPSFDFSEITPTERTLLPPIRRTEYAPSAPCVRRANTYNPGPRFLSDGTISADASMKWYKLDSLDTADTAVGPSSWFPAGWPTDEGGQVPNNDLYLWRFKHDITNLPSLQGDLNWNDAMVSNPYQLDISTSNLFPYRATYEVLTLRVISVAGQRRFNQEAVRMVVEASILDPQTGQSHDHRMEKIIKVSRR